MSRRPLIVLFAALALVGCRPDLFGGASPSPSGSPVPVTTAAPTFRFTADPESSLVTIRVREQLAGFTSTSDAILTTNMVSGVVGLTRDGRITADTVLHVDLSTIASDEP